MFFIVKNTTPINVLDLISPHSCRGCGALGSALCKRCKNNILKQNSTNCLIHKNLPPLYCAGKREGLLAILIHDYKYNSVRSIKYPLADLLNHVLPKINDNVVIVPLPTISSHIRKRGLDHTYQITKKLARLRGYQVKKILVRANNTVQVGTDRKTRLTQAKHAYTLANNAKIDVDTTYILFDDVWTTGASMKAALKKLQQAGASKIILLVLAVS